MQFYCIGGVRGGSKNQSVSGVTTICHRLRIELIRLLIVACGMLVHSSSMAVRYWQELEHAVVYADPEHPKQWVICPVTMLAMQEHTPAHTITPPPPWATRSTTLTSANRSPTRRHTHCLPSAMYSENRDSSVKRTPLQSARRHRM